MMLRKMIFTDSRLGCKTDDRKSSCTKSRIQLQRPRLLLLTTDKFCFTGYNHLKGWAVRYLLKYLACDSFEPFLSSLPSEVITSMDKLMEVIAVILRINVSVRVLLRDFSTTIFVDLCCDFGIVFSMFNAFGIH